MAKRIGKYKITKRESELSLADGGTINGNVTLGGTVTVSSNVSEGAGASLTSNQVYFTSSAALTGSGTAQLVLIKGA